MVGTSRRPDKVTEQRFSHQCHDDSCLQKESAFLLALELMTSRRTVEKLGSVQVTELELSDCQKLRIFEHDKINQNYIWQR
jgi:hypothetical protein